MKWNPDVRGEAAAVQAEYLELIEALCAIPALSLIHISVAQAVAEAARRSGVARI